MADEITIDGLGETEFRRSIENMLRNGCADEAASKLKAMLAEHAGDEKILPARFLSVSPEDVRVNGWDALAGNIDLHDRPGQAITALGIEMRDPLDAGVVPDSDGCLAPVIETNYFSDSAYPFSESVREDLLEGYSIYGCEWQGNFERADHTITIEGVDDLYGALVRLEDRVAAKPYLDPEEVCAGAVGSCYLGVLIHQAVRNTVRERGLPRPLCVFAGGSETYPYFDAPVMTCDEYRDSGVIAAMTEGPRPIEYDPDAESDGFEEFDDEAMASFSSLMGVREGKKKKTPVLTMAGADGGYSPIAEEMITAQALGEDYQIAYEALPPDAEAELAAQLNCEVTGHRAAAAGPDRLQDHGVDPFSDFPQEAPVGTDYSDLPFPVDTGDDPEPSHDAPEEELRSDWFRPKTLETNIELPPEPQVHSYEPAPYEVVRVARPSRAQVERENEDARQSRSFFARIADGFRMGGIGGVIRSIFG